MCCSNHLLSVLALSFVLCTHAFPIQAPFRFPTTTIPHSLRGRFLQISDIHPDPHYRPNASLAQACHRQKPMPRQEVAGYYGTPYSQCDSPFSLTNFTFDFLDQHWASQIDFVIWTGDNARHDNDRKVPRTPTEIYDLNRAVAKRMEEVFLKRGIPVVPALGNNDVWPHNIMAPGPNSITNEFASIWEKFIPFHNRQVFQRGGYYSVELIPNKIAAISLNTMYFYDSNKAVAGCPFTEPDDAGNLQLDWVDVQLKSYRDRNMLVYIVGHVPPSPGNYFPECHVRYSDLALRYQDTILGHLFGHMNADHFFFIEAIDLQLITAEETEISEPQPIDLYETLLREFSVLADQEDASEDDYAVVNVSPPIVPNPYLPTFRIFSYNVTGQEKQVTSQGRRRMHGHRRGKLGNKEALCDESPHRDSWKCHLNETWYTDADAPSRKNQLWTPLGYAQYYLPHLEVASETQKPDFKLEYVTFQPERLHPSERIEGGAGNEFTYPIPLENLPRSLRAGNVSASKFTPYGLEDLTVGSWMSLARRLAEERRDELRKQFRQYMYLGAAEEGK